MQKGTKTLRLIENINDIQLLHIGMSVFKYNLKGNSSKEVQLDTSNMEELEIKDIELSYIVLCPSGNVFVKFPLAKDFNRMIIDKSWWYSVD